MGFLEGIFVRSSFWVFLSFFSVSYEFFFGFLWVFFWVFFEFVQGFRSSLFEFFLSFFSWFLAVFSNSFQIRWRKWGSKGRRMLVHSWPRHVGIVGRHMWFIVGRRMRNPEYRKPWAWVSETLIRGIGYVELGIGYVELRKLWVLETPTSIPCSGTSILYQYPLLVSSTPVPILSTSLGFL